LTDFPIRLMLSPQVEEVRMGRRLNYLAIAIMLTLLDAVVTVHYGIAIWAAWSGDIPARGLLVLFAASGATSLANVWMQAGSSLRVGSEETEPPRNPVPISVEMKGQSDV
jgi:hypothetical protein